jgi:hypothetical protein
VPGVTNLIYAQTMAESLATAEGPAGGPVQTRVLALAEALNEQEEFNAALAAHEIEGIGMALEDACLERRILIVSFVFITGTPQPKPSCRGMDAEKDPEKLDAERLATQEQYQSLLSQIAEARVSAQFEGDPRAETTAATLSSRATIEAFKVGRLQLTEALIMAEKTDIEQALEATRQYAVSSQSDLNELEKGVSDLEYIVPHSQDWHERHHDEIAEDPLWTDLKVSAGDVTRDLSFAKDATGKEYRHLGGVEGSIRLFIEEQRQDRGQVLAQAQEAVVIKEQHLASASANAQRLQTLLLSGNKLTSARVEAESSALQTLLFTVQVWHLTWGVLACLVGALLGEYLGSHRSPHFACSGLLAGRGSAFRGERS